MKLGEFRIMHSVFLPEGTLTDSASWVFPLSRKTRGGCFFAAFALLPPSDDPAPALADPLAKLIQLREIYLLFCGVMTKFRSRMNQDIN